MVTERITKIIAFLRAEIPTRDIAKNPVVKHPHNTSRFIPERLPPATIKELSVFDSAKAIRATAEEWVAIAAAIAVCSFFWHPALYVAAVVVIGSRQHALLILGHDASHGPRPGVRAMPISRLCLAATLLAVMATGPAVAGEDVGAGQEIYQAQCSA